jgi:hypothetical protein
MNSEVDRIRKESGSSRFQELYWNTLERAGDQSGHLANPG